MTATVRRAAIVWMRIATAIRLNGFGWRSDMRMNKENRLSPATDTSPGNGKPLREAARAAKQFVRMTSERGALKKRSRSVLQKLAAVQRRLRFRWRRSQRFCLKGIEA